MCKMRHYTPCLLILPEEASRDLYTDIDMPGGVHGDAGTDLRFPENVNIPPWEEAGAVQIDLQVHARLAADGRYSAYFLMPRSCISGTPLVMANSLGLIDAGYTGPLKVSVWNLSKEVYIVGRGAALFQLVAPDCQPARVRVVEKEHAAFAPGATLRGAAGFGSTGVGGVTGESLDGSTIEWCSTGSGCQPEARRPPETPEMPEARRPPEAPETRRPPEMPETPETRRPHCTIIEKTSTTTIVPPDRSGALLAVLLDVLLVPISVVVGLAAAQYFGVIDR
jgi:dUTP pyrophosphatase